MTRELLVRVTIKDCEVQTFRAGGKGGQNQNVRDTGVRVIHPPSGAVGEARDTRHQLQNKKLAFRRMAEALAFKKWLQSLLPNMPEATCTDRIRTYNMCDNYVKDHRTGDQTKEVQEVLDGNIDAIYK